MNNEKNTYLGFLGRKHHRIRFTDITECFLSRVVLLKAKNTSSCDTETISFSLLDLYTDYNDLNELQNALSGLSFSSSDELTETIADAVSATTGLGVDAHKKMESAFDYYNSHLLQRLKYMRNGDSGDFKKCIDEFSINKDHLLWTFSISIRPKIMAEIVASNIKAQLELPEKLLRIMGRKSAHAGPRVDYRKEVELLTSYLDERTKTTGEQSLSFSTKDVPFRHAIQTYELEHGNFSIAAPGTAETTDRILIPFLLEMNGLLDVDSIVIDGDIAKPDQLHVKYSVLRPSRKNIFGANSFGLAPELRASMTEHQLELYELIFQKLNASCVLGGRKDLERSTAEILSWLVKKLSYSLEEPDFLGKKAKQWLREHAADSRITMEDDFFLPFLHEKMHETFGERIKKKPEKFGGEIDILFDSIPIELKVRRGHNLPLEDTLVQEKFPPGGQAAAYAANTRIGFVLVLDLPDDETMITNLSKSTTVINKDFGSSIGFPTSIVVMAFHCHHPKPSSVRN